MNKLLRVLVTLPGILFVVMGLRWITDPAGAALAPDAIAVEVIAASLLLFASSRLPQGQ